MPANEYFYPLDWSATAFVGSQFPNNPNKSGY